MFEEAYFSPAVTLIIAIATLGIGIVFGRGWFWADFTGSKARMQIDRRARAAQRTLNRQRRLRIQALWRERLRNELQVLFSNCTTTNAPVELNIFGEELDAGFDVSDSTVRYKHRMAMLAILKTFLTRKGFHVEPMGYAGATALGGFEDAVSHSYDISIPPRRRVIRQFISISRALMRKVTAAAC